MSFITPFVFTLGRCDLYMKMFSISNCVYTVCYIRLAGIFIAKN